METCVISRNPTLLRSSREANGNWCMNILGCFLLVIFLFWLLWPTKEAKKGTDCCTTGIHMQPYYANDESVARPVVFGAAQTPKSSSDYQTYSQSSSERGFPLSMPVSNISRGSRRPARGAMADGAPSYETPGSSVAWKAGALRTPHVDDVASEWFQGRRAWSVT